MELQKLIEKYYAQIFNEELTEAEQYEAYKNITGFYGAVAVGISKLTE